VGTCGLVELKIIVGHVFGTPYSVEDYRCKVASTLQYKCHVTRRSQVPSMDRRASFWIAFRVPIASSYILLIYELKHLRYLTVRIKMVGLDRSQVGSPSAMDQLTLVSDNMPSSYLSVVECSTSYSILYITNSTPVQAYPVSSKPHNTKSF
jgi:hypothetical protein